VFKQGDGLLAFIFIATLHSVIKEIVQRETICTTSNQICAYADDIVITVTAREKIIEIYKEMKKKKREGTIRRK
jgi:hypothetical protein